MEILLILFIIYALLLLVGIKQIFKWEKTLMKKIQSVYKGQWKWITLYVLLMCAVFLPCLIMISYGLGDFCNVLFVHWYEDPDELGFWRTVWNGFKVFLFIPMLIVGGLMSAGAIRR